jgi:hypothetical protein
MADQVTAKDSGVKFTPHPEGQFVAVCRDVINLGERVEQFQNKPPRIVEKCAIVFQTGEKNPDTGELHIVSAEFTVSMNEKAGLRLLLEAWRGKSYTEEQAEEGVPVHKLEGQAALVSVEHKKSSGGRLYAKIKTIAGLPKGLTAPALNDYTRAEFWTKRKEEYASEVSKFREMHAPLKPRDTSFEDFPEALDAEDDDLPF